MKLKDAYSLKKSYDKPREHIEKQRHYFANKGLSNQGCILSLCLFNLYAEYVKQKARLDEAQAGIKIARKNISNLRDANDTTLMQKAKRK